MDLSRNAAALLLASAFVFWGCSGGPAAPAAAAEAPFVKVPDPLSGDNPRFPLPDLKPPKPGQPFTDPCFKTALVQVTQEKGLRHEYSRHDPFNVDQSMIVLHSPSGGNFLIYRTKTAPYDTKESLVKTLDLEEPRWDPTDPDVLWATRDFQILTLNVRKEEPQVVKDFTKDPTIGPILKAEPDLYRITMKDEGEASMDKRYWAFMVQGTTEDYRPRYVVTWDRKTDKVLGVLKLTAAQSEIDWVGMSPLGTYVLIGGGEDTPGKLAGMTLANKELTTFQRIDYTTAHSDVGLDSEGHEVLVMQNNRTDYVDMIPLDPKTRPIMDADAGYEGTGHVKLVRLFYDSESPLGLSSGIHISCNMAGWCVISTHIRPGDKEKNWLDRCIILVKLDPKKPRAWYLAKVYNTTDPYWEETQASITVDGSKIVWACNWGQDVGKEKACVIQLDMPKGWKDALK
jgi:hypothetical protein